MNSPEHFPVQAEYTPDGWESNGIDYADYERMSTHERKLDSTRRLERPEWAVDDNKLRALIVRYMEVRADMNKPRPGSDQLRMQRAQHFLKHNKRPAKIAAIRRQSARYVALKNSGDLKAAQKVAAQIESLDTSIISDEKISLVITGLVYYYYRLGWSSVAVAQQLKLKPPNVRALLWRLHRLWAHMKREKHPGPLPQTRFDVAQVMRLIDEGKTVNEIKAVFGFASYDPIRADLIRAGCFINRENKQCTGKGRLIDETGHVYGQWTVICRSKNIGGHGLFAKWICRCTCGTEKVFTGSCLRQGRTRRCCVTCSNRETVTYRRRPQKH